MWLAASLSVLVPAIPVVCGASTLAKRALALQGTHLSSHRGFAAEMPQIPPAPTTAGLSEKCASRR